jgi:predicted XRE-type DNA-binding protein
MRPWVDPIPEFKSQIAEELCLLTSHWTQANAAWHMHVSQSRISELRRGNLANISLEKLLQCLSHFSYELEIKSVRTTFRVNTRPIPRKRPG